MNVMAGQPDGTSCEEMRRHLNQDGSAREGAPRSPPPPGDSPSPPGDAPPPPGPSGAPPPAPPGGALCPGGAPCPCGVPPARYASHLRRMVPRPIATEVLAMIHPLPMTIVTATVKTATILVHLYALACMVALGVVATLVVVVLRGMQGKLFYKEVWLEVWVLV